MPSTCFFVTVTEVNDHSYRIMWFHDLSVFDGSVHKCMFISALLHPTIVVEFQWWTRRLPKTNAVPDGICQKLNAVSSGVCVKHKRRLKRRSYCMLIRFILTNTFESCSTNQLMQGVDLTKISRETRSFQKVFILFRITLIESVLIKVLIKQIHQRVSISRLLRVKINP